MAILNREHLLEQADQLIVRPASGVPRQTDLRRAISAAYYAVFHAIAAAAADEFVGASKRATNRYGLVYRAIDHGRIKGLCADLAGTRLPQKYEKYLPTGGFGPNIGGLCTVFGDLQEKRHLADYDPTMRFRTADAELVIKTARTAINQYGKASAARRKAFLTLLLFPPKR